MRGEICTFFDYPDCKIGADICIGDEWNPETCEVYIDAEVKENKDG